MTNTPSPTDEDRELIERLINLAREQFPAGKGDGYVLTWRQGEEIARSCLSDVAKLEEALRSLLTAPMPSDYERARTALNRSTDRAT